MRILFCNYEYPPLGGGGGVVNALLANELSKTHEVTVLTSGGFGLAEDEIIDGVRVIRVPVYVRNSQAAANFPSMAAYMYNGVRRGKALLDKEKIDIINTHFALPTGPVGNSLAHFAKLPNVLSVHGGDLYDPSKFTSPHRHYLLRCWVKHLLRSADKVVGQSQNTIQNVKTYYDSGLDVGCIPLGICRPSFRQAPRSSLGLKEDEFVLATVGRLVARKGLDRLLHILSKTRLAKFKLVVIGSGPQLDDLQSLAESLGIADSVIFTGFVEEERKYQFLHASDLYVSTSQHEGFGLVFLEAMSASLPIVCYDNGGQCDFLEHGATGMLLNINDEAGFGQALISLRKNISGRKEMARYSKHKVESYYIDSCARKYAQLFEELAST